MADQVIDPMNENPWLGRHVSVRHFEKVLQPNPKLPDHLRVISQQFYDLALHLLRQCGDGPELSVALRKLREAKDCAVLQAVLDRS